VIPRSSSLCVAALVLFGGAVSGLTACRGSSSPTAPPPVAPTTYAVEVIVRTAENFAVPADVTAFVDSAAANGVAVVDLLVKQDEDAAIPSGSAYYASAIAPRATGYESFDVLQSMLDAAHARGIKVRAWVPQFHDQAAVLAHPAWQMMAASSGQVTAYTGSHQTEYFVNPLDPAVQAYEASILAEIAARYAVDGFMLDWIRFDNYNMDLGSDSRQAFQAAYGLDPLRIDFTVAGAMRDRWNAVRTDGIAAYVHAVRRQLPADRSLGVYILPPEFIEVGQDAGKFNGDVSLLSPMCYFADWGYPIDWLWSSCLPTTVQKAGSAPIVPAMDSKLTDAQYQQIFSRLHSRYAQIHAIAWFYHGRWDATRMQRVAALSRL
jgi:hypothetical protein